jgi:hypothetical protein
LRRSRVRWVDDNLRPHPDPGRPVRGVALLNRVKAASAGPTASSPGLLPCHRRCAAIGVAACPTTRPPVSDDCPGYLSKQLPSPLGGAVTYIRGLAVPRSKGLAGGVRGLRPYPEQRRAQVTTCASTMPLRLAALLKAADSRQLAQWRTMVTASVLELIPCPDTVPVEWL